MLPCSIFPLSDLTENMSTNLTYHVITACSSCSMVSWLSFRLRKAVTSFFVFEIIHFVPWDPFGPPSSGELSYNDTSNGLNIV